MTQRLRLYEVIGTDQGGAVVSRVQYEAYDAREALGAVQRWWDARDRRRLRWGVQRVYTRDPYALLLRP